MRIIGLMVLLALPFLPHPAVAQDQAEIDRNVGLMIRLCIAGGRTETMSGNASGDANVSVRSLDVRGNLKGDFKITKGSAEGLVNGIDNAISALAADQSDKARDCLKPVRERLYDVLFPKPATHGDKGPDPKVKKDTFRSFATQWQVFSTAKIDDNINSQDTRKWKRAGSHWEESHADGSDVMYHDIVENISLNGCNGERTEKQEDKKLEMFIPYKECKNRVLMYRFNNNAWMRFGAMAGTQ